jgi:3-deoxy-D-manno-octulosonic-acid transferase
VARFLAHWDPDCGVFLESELWPNLLLTAHAKGVRVPSVAHTHQSYQRVSYAQGVCR